jgi:hypothetical protein
MVQLSNSKITPYTPWHQGVLSVLATKYSSVLDDKQNHAYAGSASWRCCFTWRCNTWGDELFRGWTHVHPIPIPLYHFYIKTQGWLNSRFRSRAPRSLIFEKKINKLWRKIQIYSYSFGSLEPHLFLYIPKCNSYLTKICRIHLYVSTFQFSFLKHLIKYHFLIFKIPAPAKTLHFRNDMLHDYIFQVLFTSAVQFRC